ncbi:gamma-glutamyltransferase family protein [Thalassospira lucentensis]|uniref:gamma-glutamyltransferase family protein n=1 Tax=Thalassospira lucentensis TaxID=168935 RepID=UPI002942A511|nr:gamma-glutamyltransferase family protein [Thalassospira lucentensis]WOI13077.1 gamma-glutamyltransferase family protein [Thalassospira lucentensis]
MSAANISTPYRAMVTSPSIAASEAGAQVLRDGGTAIEAVVATASVLAVTYPHFCGIGGDAVWMVADRTGKVSSFLGIGQAALDAKCDAGVPIALRGPASTLTTACTVDSWQHALDHSARNWGGTRKLADLIEPAITLAENGFPVSKSQCFWLDFRKDDYRNWPGFADIFAPNGRTPKAGDTFIQPYLAESLKLIAKNGARDFYEGELATRIAKGLGKVGSPIRARDLQLTRTRTADAVSLEYGNVTLFAPPAPTQGLATLMTMGILRELGTKYWDESNPDHFHLVVEAIKRAFLERDRICDPDGTNLDFSDMLGADTLRKNAADIATDHAMEWPHPFRHGDTVFLAATDAQGNCASVLQSTYFDWGSGVVAGNTGIVWQNRGAAFSTIDGHPNQLKPGKRPFYTLNPGLALRNGKPCLLYGTQGADGQPQTLAMLLTRLIDFGLSPADALARPRFLLGKTFSDSRDSLKLEADAGPTVFAELKNRGHILREIEAQSALAGQAGIIRIAPDGNVDGAHDPRSDGAAIGII